MTIIFYKLNGFGSFVFYFLPMISFANLPPDPYIPSSADQWKYGITIGWFVFTMTICWHKYGA